MLCNPPTRLPAHPPWAALQVHLVVDGVSSQRPTDRAVGVHRAAQSGAFTVTSEMALFQLMGGSTHPQFKAISKLVQEPRADPLLAMPGL